ncbi:MAG: hypothetical protein M1830_010501 [Pleopsidium flavum]|nr:MAG: hypothetical protein M1830_010501 [Pleopsidium flavum]
MEQTGLLNWGDKIGLVEGLFDRPSQMLHLNRNLIIDILTGIQALFKSCLKIQGEYDSVVPVEWTSSDHIEEAFDRRFPKGTNTILTKAFRAVEEVPQVLGRLQWAAVKKDSLESLVDKLIGYNDALQAFWTGQRSMTFK